MHVTGRAHCPLCNRDDVETRKERGVETYKPHNRTRDGDAKCLLPGGTLVRAEDRR